MHLLGADLHFDGHAVGPEQGGVQGLIAVHARYGDVVLEPAGHGLVDAVDQSQGPVAGVGAVDDDAKAVHVDHFVQRDFLVLHLAIDAVQMLLPTLDAADDVGLLQGCLEGLGDLADEFLLIAAGPLQFPFEHLVAVGVQRPEAQVLELELHRVQAEALGDGGVDFQGLAGRAAALHRRHDAQGAHVVHAVGELDHDDADVAHHGQQHLAEAFGLGLLAVLELDLSSLLTPSTSSATTCPKMEAISALAVGVSSMTSCRMAATRVSASRPQIREDVGHRHRWVM